MKIVIAGATGFIGSAAVRACSSDGHEVVALVREGRTVEGARPVVWDAKTVGDWASELEAADVAINLCGLSVSIKWSEANRAAILSSRVESTRAFRQAVDELSRPPRVWMNASAVGIYGDTGDRAVDESDGPGTGFLPETCTAWEAEAYSSRTRVVHLRTGLVLGQGGGMFPLLEKLAKVFFGGAVGSGKQYMPWIHIDDHIRLMRWCANGTVSGPINLCAPEPATNADLMAALRKAMGRPWAPPAPAIALKALGAVGGPDPELSLMSSRVIPALAKAKGFTWRYGALEEALANLVS